MDTDDAAPGRACPGDTLQLERVEQILGELDQRRELVALLRQPG
jgi:hypothetical protein